jgi:hypothetical protein
LLAAIGLKGSGDLADPAELFCFRNLDLLAEGGALAIVMPDGVVQSDRFKVGLEVYEKLRRVSLTVSAIVSLPATTFALGGTVAKTSFLIVGKGREPDRPLYLALARHVGFVKRGKRRSNDPHGNELLKIAEEFGGSKPAFGKYVDSWRVHSSFVPAKLMHAEAATEDTPESVRLSELVAVARDYAREQADADGDHYHISVLDIDETGLLDVISAKLNKPMSRGCQCRTGDILLSCMNPKIWRVGVVPDIAGEWTCSPEFVVLRPKKLRDAWRIALALHHPQVVQAVQATAKGTSSSRQRVPKNAVLTVNVPKLAAGGRLNEYVQWRQEYYKKRLREGLAFQAIHDGDSKFSW